jgi:hypothetical protein
MNIFDGADIDQNILEQTNPVFNTAPYFWLFLGLCASGEDVRSSLLQPEEPSSGSAFLTSLYYKLAVFVCLLLCVGSWISLNTERNRELADLQAMALANARSRTFIDPSFLRDGNVSYYWYDKKEDAIFPTFSDMPEPYGLGTGNSSGGLSAFAKENGFFYSNYDENVDYTDKVLVVAAALDPEGQVQIAMNWYAPHA